jgi:PAS domain S-box-containing protein
VFVAVLVCLLNARVRAAQRRAELHALEAERNQALLLQNQEHLRESEERFRLLIEGVHDYAIFMLDREGRFTSWNNGAERILGYQEAEILGQPFSRIFTPEDIENNRPDQALQTAIATGQAQDNRWHLRKDGIRLWAHGNVTPIRDETGNFRGFAKILQDMTERKRAEEERAQLLKREQAARAEAEEANRAKDEFLAIISHELRTPLTAIVGWIGMLQTGMLDEDRAAIALDTLERNANLQAQLIEDLLDISRIIRGELRLDYSITLS